jgi:hypothetical protein
MYGIDQSRSAVFGKQCLQARRLVERGVRFVQLYSGGNHNDANWDAHGDLFDNHTLHAGETDKPIAGLIKDLKQRGQFDEGVEEVGLGRLFKVGSHQARGGRGLGEATGVDPRAGDDHGVERVVAFLSAGRSGGGRVGCLGAGGHGGARTDAEDGEMDQGFVTGGLHRCLLSCPRGARLVFAMAGERMQPGFTPVTG